MTKAIVEDAIDRGVHRLLADGVHYRDMRDVRAVCPNWETWPHTWAEKAEEVLVRAQSALDLGAKETAAAEFARASLYFHYAQYMFFSDLKFKKELHDRKVASFHKAAPLLETPIELVEIPYESITLKGYFRAPKGIPNAPCVILLGGLDTTKEDYLNVNELCIRRGLATLAFDGPGQGETQFEMLFRPDFENSIKAALDYLATRSEIDQNRIGIIGRSMGGCYAPKIAAIDSRIKALVAWGVMYHLRNLAEIAPHTVEGFLYVSGTKSIEEGLAFYECVDLAAYAPKIKCPTLIIHGGLDKITPMENAKKLMETIGSDTVETLMWDDSIHCCHDRSHIIRPAMPDFLARYL